MEWATHTSPCWGIHGQVGSMALPVTMCIVPTHCWKPNNVQWDLVVSVPQCCNRKQEVNQSRQRLKQVLGELVDSRDWNRHGSLALPVVSTVVCVPWTSSCKMIEEPQKTIKEIWTLPPNAILNGNLEIHLSPAKCHQLLPWKPIRLDIVNYYSSSPADHQKQLIVSCNGKEAIICLQSWLLVMVEGVFLGVCCRLMPVEQRVTHVEVKVTDTRSW